MKRWNVGLPKTPDGFCSIVDQDGKMICPQAVTIEIARQICDEHNAPGAVDLVRTQGELAKFRALAQTLIESIDAEDMARGAGAVFALRELAK